MKTLRPYQQNLIDRVIAAFKAGKRKIIIQLPTGGGKSVVFSKIISGASQKGTETLFIVHRRELVNQASNHLLNEGVEHGVIMSKVTPNLVPTTQVSSIQTLWARIVKSGKLEIPEPGMIIVDEAHHCTSKTYDHFLKKYKDAFLIGVTATPISKTGKGLGHYFDELIIGATVRELTEAGFLAEASYMVPEIPDLENVPSRSGDWVEKALAGVMNDAKIVGNVVDHYLEYAEHRKMVCFAVNVEHSRALVREFISKGVPAAHIDAKTPTKDRDMIIAAFSAGEYKILSNCEVFTEGVDMPDVDGVILARPTKSLRMYLQMAGRGLRPKSDGGDCLILDHTGNVLRHGPVDREHDWGLAENETIYERDARKREDKEKKAKEFVCGNCGYIFKRSNVCPKCKTPLPTNAEDVETAAGKLVGMPKTKKPKKKEASRDEKQKWFSMFLLHAAENGYKPGWAYYKYKAKFKEQVPRTFHHGLEKPTEEFRNYIKYLAIRASYAQRRR